VQLHFTNERLGVNGIENGARQVLAKSLVQSQSVWDGQSACPLEPGTKIVFDIMRYWQRLESSRGGKARLN
jgi:hypothetical protein